MCNVYAGGGPAQMCNCVTITANFSDGFRAKWASAAPVGSPEPTECMCNVYATRPCADV